jgi:hypothetical protein
LPLSLAFAAKGVGTGATVSVLCALSSTELCEFGKTSVIAAIPTRLTKVTDTAAAAIKGWIRLKICVIFLKFLGVNGHLACVRIKRSNDEMGCTQTVSFVMVGNDDLEERTHDACQNCAASWGSFARTLASAAWSMSLRQAAATAWMAVSGASQAD